jgi:hypothetical protein
MSSGPANFGSFLNGAVAGVETGADMREKYDIYKQRRKNRKDNEKAEKALATELKPLTPLVVTAKPIPTAGGPSPTNGSGAQAASSLGAGVYDESMYNSDAPLASSAALRRGAGARPTLYDRSIRRLD